MSGLTLRSSRSRGEFVFRGGLFFLPAVVYALAMNDTSCDGLARISHEVDFCVVGGGLAGLCAAVAAARHGASVVLMHDRPMPGGNASSEIRMWVCGALGENNRETGLIEEIELANIHRNPRGVWPLWDTVLWELADQEANLTLLLNCSACGAEMDDGCIASVSGWQSTTQQWHDVRAKLFADCSGDSILAPLTGAEFRLGREARGEFDEDIAPDSADELTMGMSCLIQARQYDTPQPFVRPDWANLYETDEDLPNRDHDLTYWATNFWWLELGGMEDTIGDTEAIRDKLLKVALGVWDHIKNRGDHGAECWGLDWIGMLPGKRESRRYLGDHILTQNDVRSEGRFDDLIAYGGWPMDDHHPAGFDYPGEPTIFHPAPSPFGIPYRCVYSSNIENLYFAGRNISATHAALSSTRVMATCATLGQAIGTAAAMACGQGLSPRQLGQQCIEPLQDALQDDDCYLPWRARPINELTRAAQLRCSTGDAEPLRNGWDRPIGEAENAWPCSGGEWVEYRFETPQAIGGVRLVADSDLNRKAKNLPASYPLGAEPRTMPGCLVRDLRIEGETSDGQWVEMARVSENRRRLICIESPGTFLAVRVAIESTWSGPGRLFGFDLLPERP